MWVYELLQKCTVGTLISTFVNLTVVYEATIICTMSTQRTEKLNWLAQHLPEGIPVDAAWLRSQGYTANLLRRYVASGWLEQPVHRVYIRPRGPLVWEQVAVSLQTFLRH